VGCPRTFPRSKHLNLSYERAFGASAANQEMHIATQHKICVANQDTAEHSKTYVQPIRSEKIKQWRRDRPRSDALVFRTAPASIVGHRLKNCLPLSASSVPPRGFQRVTHGINILTNIPAIRILHYRMNRINGKAMSTDHALEALCLIC
jgi:hypothetical protein